jgi:hypothetical protein
MAHWPEDQKRKDKLAKSAYMVAAIGFCPSSVTCKFHFTQGSLELSVQGFASPSPDILTVCNLVFLLGLA